MVNLEPQLVLSPRGNKAIAIELNSFEFVARIINPGKDTLSATVNWYGGFDSVTPVPYQLTPADLAAALTPEGCLLTSPSSIVAGLQTGLDYRATVVVQATDDAAAGLTSTSVMDTIRFSVSGCLLGAD